MCNRVNVLQEMQCTKHRQIGSLRTRTKMFLETLIYSPFNHLTQPLAQKYFIKFSYHESFQLYITLLWHIIQQTDTLMLTIIRQTAAAYLKSVCNSPVGGVCEWVHRHTEVKPLTYNSYIISC